MQKHIFQHKHIYGDGDGAGARAGGGGGRWMVVVVVMVGHVVLSIAQSSERPMITMTCSNRLQFFKFVLCQPCMKHGHGC